MKRSILRGRRWFTVVAAVAVALTVGVATASATHLTSLTIAPATQAIQPGGTATFTGNVGTNTDCPESYGFNLSVSGVPAGASSSLSTTGAAPGGPLVAPYSVGITAGTSTPDGTYTITVRVDYFGPNCAPGPRTVSATLVVDSAAPTITASALSNGGVYTGGTWTNHDVVVHYSCTDNAGGSGVASLTGDQTIAAEGADQSATGTCVDQAGNSASATFGSVDIDTTAPTVAYSGNAGTYTVADTIAITCNATDALSGIASSTCADVAGPASSFALGTHTFSATATDNAGNTGTGTTSFVVTADYNSLCALVGQLSTSPGVAQGLCAKLAAASAAAARGQQNTKANIIGAFTNQVDAQTGKALTSAQAALLESLVATL